MLTMPSLTPPTVRIGFLIVRHHIMLQLTWVFFPFILHMMAPMTLWLEMRGAFLLSTPSPTHAPWPPCAHYAVTNTTNNHYWLLNSGVLHHVTVDLSNLPIDIVIGDETRLPIIYTGFITLSTPFLTLSHCNPKTLQSSNLIAQRMWKPASNNSFPKKGLSQS